MSAAGLAPAAALAAALLAGASGGERFTLFWSTVDGGGTNLARSGRFLLAGTAGQPDAGRAESGGAPFALQAGFFSEGFPLPAYAIFVDDFEWGDARRWSVQQPPG